MITDKRKVALVGTGLVGMSYAYAVLNQNICDEMLLIDIDKSAPQERLWTLTTAWHSPVRT